MGSGLAIDGGKPALSEPLAPYNSIAGELPIGLPGPLSGYLGGESKGGYWCEKLEAEWCKTFGVKHAIAVNSATSGLLAACVAADIRQGDHVLTTPYTMSATAAAPKFLGADLCFADINLSDYCIDSAQIICNKLPTTRAVIVTNLFGHPAKLAEIRKNAKTIIIEDNAQAPFAMEHGKYTGTIGHIGVFSLNVHKHFQAGEGGICVTNNDGLAEIMRAFRNHGEMAGFQQVGLNLRMTEVTAAIACAQLARGKELVSQRVEIAEEIISGCKGLPGVMVPSVRKHCRHVFYCLPFWIEQGRDWFIEAMRAEGVPLQAGYVKPLHHMPAFRKGFGKCPRAELAHKRVALYENCAWTPTSNQIKQTHEAFKKVADANQWAEDRAG